MHLWSHSFITLATSVKALVLKLRICKQQTQKQMFGSHIMLNHCSFNKPQMAQWTVINYELQAKLPNSKQTTL